MASKKEMRITDGSYVMPVLYLKVDESGTPGKRQKGKTHYILAGCLVKDETGFDNAAAKRYRGKELKFHDDRNLRKPIITEAEPFVEAVYYVDFVKPAGWHKDDKGHETERTEALEHLHKSLLQSLARGISQDNPGTMIRTVIDHNNLIADEEARDIVAAQSGPTVRICPAVADSKSDFGLMTNDFFVGAIGYMLNTPYDAKNPRKRFVYTDLFKDKIIELPFRDYSIPVLSKNVGNPGCRYPATSQATQTSYGFQTTSPAEAGLRSRTRTSTPNSGYKTAARKKKQSNGGSSIRKVSTGSEKKSINKIICKQFEE